MLLNDKYYSLISMREEGQHADIFLSLRPDCDVYRGHFPGNPICPAVCNIEMIKECAQKVIGKRLQIRTIKQCRLTAIASPSICPKVEVDLQFEPNTKGYVITARIFDPEKVYVDFKGEMTV